MKCLAKELGSASSLTCHSGRSTGCFWTATAI